MNLRDQLLSVAKTYADRRGLSLSRVSTLVFNDGKKLESIEGGTDLHTERFEKAMLWFSINFPEGAVWPADVPRPGPEASAASEMSSVA